MPSSGHKNDIPQETQSTQPRKETKEQFERGRSVESQGLKLVKIKKRKEL